MRLPTRRLLWSLSPRRPPIRLSSPFPSIRCHSSSKSRGDEEESKKTGSVLPLQRLQLRTCRDAYSRLWTKGERPPIAFRSCPSDGITLPLDYLDIKGETDGGEGAAGYGKTVLLLHGSGRSVSDFDRTAQALCSAGFRVIAPVFPGESAVANSRHDWSNLAANWQTSDGR